MLIWELSVSLQENTPFHNPGTAMRNQHFHDENANKLLNDLDRYPHAYVLAGLMDRQIKAERAWIIPYEIKK